jgi:hypothetical protein
MGKNQNKRSHRTKIIFHPLGSLAGFPLYEMKPRKHTQVKYCWQAYFKFVGTLSQPFKNHTHNK